MCVWQGCFGSKDAVWVSECVVLLFKIMSQPSPRLMEKEKFIVIAKFYYYCTDINICTHARQHTHIHTNTHTYTVNVGKMLEILSCEAI